LGNIIYALDERDDKTFRYTRAQRRHETGRKKHRKILEDLKKKKDINVLEADIGKTNSKSCNYSSFRQYIRIKNKKRGLDVFYEDILMRKLKLREKINTQRSENKLLNNLKRISESLFFVLETVMRTNNYAELLRHLI